VPLLGIVIQRNTRYIKVAYY